MVSISWDVCAGKSHSGASLVVSYAAVSTLVSTLSVFSSSLILLPLMALSEISPVEINGSSVVSGPLVPHLGLSCCLDAPFRVYVLECVHHLGGLAPALYVGIERAGGIRGRIQSHFQEQGAHFTQVNKPSRVQLTGAGGKPSTWFPPGRLVAPSARKLAFLAFRKTEQS